MRAAPTVTAGLIVALATVSACVPAETAEKGEFKPEYLGIETIRLDNDLVNFRVAMKGARNTDDVDDYARCAAAQYALIRGAGFARHVRTNVAKRTGGVWLGDAVYTISATLPLGLRNIDAEVEVRACGEKGIPTV
ncbi:MAG: hypothetical protein QM656_14520 [Paracoccaceae bacterium]